MTATLSPSVHEAVIAKHFSKGTDDAVLKHLHDAVKTAREMSDKASNLTTKVLANELKTPAARHKQARDAGFELLQRATGALDEAMKAAQTEIASIKARIKGPSPAKDAVGELRAQFMLTRLAAMKPEARSAILDKAVAEGQDQVIAAVLSVDPWVSEMSAAEINLVRHAWARKHYPADLARLDRLEKAIDDTKRAGTLTIAFIDQLTDAKLIASAEHMEKAASEALKEVAS